MYIEHVINKIVSSDNIKLRSSNIEKLQDYYSKTNSDGFLFEIHDDFKISLSNNDKINDNLDQENFDNYQKWIYKSFINSFINIPKNNLSYEYEIHSNFNELELLFLNRLNLKYDFMYFFRTKLSMKFDSSENKFHLYGLNPIRSYIMTFLNVDQKSLWIQNIENQKDIELIGQGSTEDLEKAIDEINNSYEEIEKGSKNFSYLSDLIIKSNNKLAKLCYLDKYKLIIKDRENEQKF